MAAVPGLDDAVLPVRLREVAGVRARERGGRDRADGGGGGQQAEHGKQRSRLGVVLATLTAFALGGESAVRSAAAGAGVVLVVLVVGLVGISAVLAADAALSMAGAAVVYIGQIILIVASLLLLREREWLDGRAFAIAAVSQVLLMQLAQVIGYTRGRQVVDADLPAPASGGEGP